MRRIFAIAFLIVVVIGLISAYYLYNKPHVDVSSHSIDYSSSVDDLLTEFTTDATAANQKYAGKIILLSGELFSDPEKDDFNIILKGSTGMANCAIDSSHVDQLKPYKAGDQLNVKGIFVGFDDLLGELQMKKCLIPE